MSFKCPKNPKKKNDPNEMETEEGVEDSSSDESEDEMEEESGEGNAVADADKEVYLPGKPLEEGEQLVCDQSAYVMLHQAQTGAPCLSFDIIQDQLGANRDSYPLTSYLVCGTQAARTHVNHLIVMRMSNLQKTGEEESDEEDDEDDESKRPQMNCALIKHQGSVNRVRSTTVNSKSFAASWSELGRVNIWDLSVQLAAVEDSLLLQRYKTGPEANATPVFSFSGHQQEGFGIDWCPTSEGTLATGDCRRDIHIWQPQESSWFVDQRPLVGHTASVEDLQWSPNERNVLASCSVDKSIRVWDTRAAPNKACMLTAENAHESDINVISWNRNEPFIASGGDDGFLHIWDLRQFQSKTPVATFKHHTNFITTVEWHPTEATVLASGGADNQIAQWDLSVECDTDETNTNEIEGVPPQLLFIHQGQTDIKELHWHPQIPGVIISTALSGFNIFRTISV